MTALGDLRQIRRPRIAQPRKARQKGLASESSRRLRRIAKNLHRGIRGCFCVRSPEIAIRGGNYAQAGARDIRCKARGVTPSRNVIGWVEVIAKLGRTVAAGSGSSGARDRSPWWFKSPVWEWPASRSGREPSEDAARQWQPRLRVYGWCRTQGNDESGDGFFPVSITYRRPGN
jgi:hypothetical protein